jgi:hypothetical protein
VGTLDILGRPQSVDHADGPKMSSVPAVGFTNFCDAQKAPG